jgi:hypothetical protein
VIALACFAFALAAAAVAEIALPGRAVYHAGWFNVALSAMVVMTFVAARKELVRSRDPRALWAAIALTTGAAIAGFAAVASGLLAPDDATIVGAPGQRVRVESLGTLSFPLASAGAPAAVVMLERPRHRHLEIGDRRRDVGNFVVRTFERDVAYVEASDARGSRLTITQPAGSVFLSPVLLMQHRQTIAGMDLPYDSFDVPAVRRVVKAVLFTPAQAATLSHGVVPGGDAAILFAVDDENEKPLRNAIALSVGGRTVRAGGLSLRGASAQYPAVEIASTPNVVATGAGVLLVFGGLLALLVRPALPPRDDRANVAHDDAPGGGLDPSRG